jgi:hypothetical protein
MEYLRLAMYIEQVDIVGYTLNIELNLRTGIIVFKISTNTDVTVKQFSFEDIRMARTDIIQIWLSSTIEYLLRSER